MEIKINKEIRSFNESLFFGLNLRQFICSLLAVGAAIGVYFLLRDIVGQEEVGWICILCAIPFALVGFFKYQGLPLEVFALAWLRTQFIYPRKMHFQAENQYIAALGAKPNKQAKGARKQDV